MGLSPKDYDEALTRASEHARAWLTSLPARQVSPRTGIREVMDAVAGPLPEEGTAPGDVIDLLAAHVEPGLMAMGSGRFFGWVIGGTLPSALAADWLVSTWDQNSVMRYATPGVVGVEEAAAAWLLELLGLPASSAVGFVTGATMANFTALAAARQHVLTKAGWDLDADGLSGAPRIRVLVGADRHVSVDLALRYLGLGAPTPVEADDQGRILPTALAEALQAGSGPTIVVLQAGNLHSGAFDPFAACIDVAHEHGAWVHVDGAFGLWAGASPALRHLVDGVERADSWATDAHKTLNTPYDCGVVIVRHTAPLHAAMGFDASYLVQDSDGVDPFQCVPEFSRRARGVPVWAALKALGRRGVRDLVDNLVTCAAQLAAGMTAIPGARVVNDVVYTQVCVAFDSDLRTRQITERLLEGGTTWMSGSRWRGHDVLRISVSNWSTDDADVAASLQALRAVAK